MADTIGRKLKQERERRNLTLEQVSVATHIRARHLEAIEADRLDDLPSRQSSQGFLRLYADYLGLNLDPITTQPSTDALSENTLVDLYQEAQPENGEEPTITPSDIATSQEVGKIEGEIEETSHAPKPEPGSPLSSIIFGSIGDQLRRQREVLGFSFDEVERHTHVRRHYLEALESGDFDHLPSSVQARGMLSNYARFLDLDADAILLRFAEGLQERLREKQPIPDQEQASQKDRRVLPKIIRSLLSFDVIFGGGLIILLVTFAIWGTSQVISNQQIPAPASTLSISEALLETPTPVLEVTLPASPVAEITSIPEENGTAIPLPTALQGRIQVVTIILERTWMRVTVDDRIEFEGRALPGTTYSFGGDQRIEVLTSNGSAVQISYNQNDLGVMGNFGEIVGRIYTEAGIFIPTPTITPTPTRTKPATPGPARTVTPVELP